MNKIYTITKDISANYKKLRLLEKRGIIRIINIRIENNKDRKSAILPTGVLGHTYLGTMLLGSANQKKVFDELKSIIGVNHIKDCEHLEAHIRDKYDYFVTEDTDILKHKQELEKEFAGLKIRTVNELLKELNF